MTVTAKLPPGVLLGVYLRKTLWLCDVLGMASDAKMGDVWLLRRHARRVVGVLCQRAVAGLAVHSGVHTFPFGFGNIWVASLAGFVARISDGPRGNLSEGVPTVIPILPKAFGKVRAPEDEEQDQADQEDPGHAKQVSNIFELDHSGPAKRPIRSNVCFYIASAHRTIGPNAHDFVRRVTEWPHPSQGIRSKKL